MDKLFVFKKGIIVPWNAGAICKTFDTGLPDKKIIFGTFSSPDDEEVISLKKFQEIIDCQFPGKLGEIIKNVH